MNPDPHRDTPPKDTSTTGNRRPLLVARLVIALGLLVGVTIFGISAANDLMASMDRLATPPAADPAAPQWQTPHAEGFGDPNAPIGESLLGSNYRQIDHDPGGLAAMPGSVREVAVQQKPTNGLTEEQAHYIAPLEDAIEAIDHYRRVAEQDGFNLRMPPGPMTRRAGGMNLQMQRGRQTLSVNAWPMDPSRPSDARPPLRPTTPYRITVILQYPVANPPATGDTPPRP